MLRRPGIGDLGLLAERGSVENTNGRLRGQLPRHLDRDIMSIADRQDTMLSHNRTPRKGRRKEIEIRLA